MGIFASLGGALLGGVFQSKAASKASDAQVQATQLQVDAAEGAERRARAERNRNAQVSAGVLQRERTNAIDALTSATGQARNILGNETRVGIRDLRQGNILARDQLRGGARDAINTLQTGAGQARGEINSGIDSAIGAYQSGADDQIASYDQAYGQQKGFLKPVYQRGDQANDAYMYESGFGDRRPEGYRGFEESGAYQHRLEKGNDAISNLAGAAGNLFSGATLKRAAEYNSGEAAQEYGSHLARLQGVGARGDNARAQMAGYAGQRGANVANVQGNLASQTGGLEYNRGNALSGITQGLAANRANIQQGLAGDLSASNMAQGAAISNMRTQNGVNQANMVNALGGNISGINSAIGSNLANVWTGLGSANAAGLMNLGDAQANAYADQGNAQAAGAIGQGNAWTNALNNGIGAYNYYQQYQGQPQGQPAYGLGQPQYPSSNTQMWNGAPTSTPNWMTGGLY